jgi:hypothetical protein
MDMSKQIFPDEAASLYQRDTRSVAGIGYASSVSRYRWQGMLVN